MSDSRQMSIQAQNAMNNSVALCVAGKVAYADLYTQAEEFLRWTEEKSSGSDSAKTSYSKPKTACSDKQKWVIENQLKESPNFTEQEKLLILGRLSKGELPGYEASEIIGKIKDVQD